MASSRIFFRRLLLLCRTSSLSNPTTSSCSLLVQLRPFSAKADALEPNNTDGAAAKPEKISPIFAIFEDMIHGMIVQEYKPKWLPFVPGSSFWVPPMPKRGSFFKAFENLSVALSDEETMALTTMRGWPSSAFFLRGNKVDLRKSDTGDTKDQETTVPAADASSSEDKKD